MDPDIGLDLADHARLATGIIERLTARCAEAFLSLDAAVLFHSCVKELSGVIRDLVNEADRLVIEGMGDERKAVVGEKVVEVRRSYRRFDWDHPRLAERVAIIALGGEVRTETKNIVDALLTACRPEWRVTALKDMGIDDSDFCSRELGRAQVSVL